MLIKLRCVDQNAVVSLEIYTLLILHVKSTFRVHKLSTFLKSKMNINSIVLLTLKKVDDTH